MMRTRRILFAAIVAVALAPGASAWAQQSPEARRVIDRARAATGGRAWNALPGLHEVGVDGGLRYERWLDPLRYGARSETHIPAGKVVRGYNGAGAWWQNPAGAAPLVPPTLAEARSDAYFAAYGYYFPSRFDLRTTYVGVRNSGGRPFEVIQVQPAGGETRELWFDRGAGLLGRMVYRAGPQQVTVEMSDYRRVGSVRVPFRFTTYGGGLSQPQERQVEAVDFRRADRDLFSLPRPKGR